MKKIFTLFLIVSSLAAQSQSLVISQVYGGGGNGGSVYKNDFVELFNPTETAINIKGWSVQYNSATSTTTTWKKTLLPDVSILPGHYYLIQEAQGTGGTTVLPTPDLTGDLAINGTTGKIVLVSDTNNIAIACPTTNVIDKMGFGPNVNCFEGTAPAPLASNTTAILRANGGCTDTDVNSSDFTAVAPEPRNSSSPVHSCGAVAASLTATPSTVPDFGLITAGMSSEPLSFDLSGSDLTGASGDITITSPSADFEVSSDNLTWGPSTTIPYTSSSLAATTVFVRFTPQSVGDKTGNITITGGGVAAAVLVAVSGAGLSTLTPLLSASTLIDFGNLCVNATSNAKTLAISGSNLTADSIKVGPLAGYSFSAATAGTYSTTLKLAQPGGSFTRDIFVKFTPVLLQSYNGNIPVTGGGATDTANAAVTGAGTNTAPLETTEAANGITAFKATLAGLISDKGCTAISAYGFEYSAVNGFANGTGTVVSSSNETTGNFSADISGLLPSTIYYFKAFATNGAGKTYGSQRSFTTLICAAPADSTGKATGITTNVATLPGSITDIGCTAVTAYGIQYTSIRNFTNGYATMVAGSNAANNSFSVTVSGLVQNTKYYYRTFATNTGGTSFGGIDSFTTVRIAPGLVVYSNPVSRGGTLHFSIDNLSNEYYAAQLISSYGQIVYQKNMIVQVGFIDDNFIIPAKLPAGVYILKVLNIAGFEAKKSILVL